MLCGHGDDGYRYGVPIRANFSSNVWADADLKGLREHLFENFEPVRSYPEVMGESLTRTLADRHGVSPDQIIITAGATAGIYLVAQTFRRRHSAIVVPTFSEYADAANAHEHRVSAVSRSDFAAGTFSDADLVWLCNPNNPTGEVFSRSEVLELAARFPDARFVIDLAYADYCREPSLAATDTRTHENLILIHSLTKPHGVPGLRLGYIVAAPATASAVARCLWPWAVCSLALQAGQFLLSKRNDVTRVRDSRLAETNRLIKALSGIPGVAIRQSHTTFFVLELAGGSARELKAHLLRSGLLVRDASNFAGLGDRHVRICTQTLEQDRWLEEAITQWARS